MFRCLTAVCLGLVVTLSGFAQTQTRPPSEENTPFKFVQRNDVRLEINASDEQVTAVQALESQLDSLSQEKLQEFVANIDDNALSQFQQLSPEDQASTLVSMQNDVRESSQMELLEQRVLDNQQMGRFKQLYTQQAGVEGLMSGRVANALNITPTQLTQIQNVINVGNVAMQASKSSGLPFIQQNIQIQNIQNNMIDLCVVALNDEQIGSFLEMFGEPFEFDTDAASDPFNESNDDLPSTTETDALVSDPAEATTGALMGSGVSVTKPTDSEVNQGSAVNKSNSNPVNQAQPSFKKATPSFGSGSRNSTPTTRRTRTR